MEEAPGEIELSASSTEARQSSGRMLLSVVILVGAFALAVGTQFEWLKSTTYSGWVGYAPLSGAINVPGSKKPFYSPCLTPSCSSREPVHLRQLVGLRLDHPVLVFFGVVLAALAVTLLAGVWCQVLLAWLALGCSALVALLVAFRMVNLWYVENQFIRSSLTSSMGAGMWLALIGALLVLLGSLGVLVFDRRRRGAPARSGQHS